jgi:CHAT domain-containing protein/tetratricopeptide (TPR) repeat protein
MGLLRSWRGAKAAREMLAAVFEYLEMNTQAQISDCLRRHPALLDESADVLLGEMVATARKHGRDDVAAKLSERRALLADLRHGSTAPQADELRQALAEIQRVGPADDEQRIRLLRQALAQPDLATQAELRAALLGALAASLASVNERTGSDDYEEAIAAIESALAAQSRASAPGTWAVNMLNRGKFYARHGAGVRASNIETAIRCFSEVLASDDEPVAGMRADTAVELAAAYMEVGGGDNVEKAIALCETALESADADTLPVTSANAHQVLGRAYLVHDRLRRADNIEQAIAHLNAAATVLTPQQYPDDWASLQCDLGTAFCERLSGDRAENISQAIEHFETIAGRGRDGGSLRTYAVARTGLGRAYGARTGPDRERDLESAIACFGEAIEVLAELGLAEDRAAVQLDLAQAYLERHAGSRSDNVERAIGLLEDTLHVHARDAVPRAWAQSQFALGNAYLRRGYGERGRNVELAIAAYTGAVAEFADQGATRLEAIARQSLGQAYFSRVTEDREASVRDAISNLTAAEAVFAAHGMVASQAAALSGLGDAYSEQASWSGPDAADRAISFHRQALGLLGDRSAHPDERAIITNNLGTCYLERPGARRPGDIKAAIGYLEESLSCGSAARSAVDQGMTRHNLAVAYAELAGEHGAEDLDRAIGHAEAALEAFMATGLSLYRRATAQVLGDAYSRRGDRWPRAFRAYQVALDAADDLYTASLGLDARETELAAAPGLHARASYAAAKIGQVSEAVAILERGRARGTGEALARDLAGLNSIRAADSALADAFAAAAADVRRLEMAEHAGRGARRRHQAAVGSADAGTDSELAQDLAAARGRLAGVVTQIRALGGDHSRFLAQPGFDDIAEIVTMAGPLAYVAVTDYGSVTAIIAPSRDSAGVRPAAHLVPEPVEPLTSQMLRSLLIKTGDDGVVTGGYLPALMEASFPAGVFRQELENVLSVLGERLARPLARHLDALGVDAVTVVACGLLGLLPLHAASYRADGTQEPCCLLDTASVSYAPSARVLAAARVALAGSRGQREAAPVLAGVGNPDPARPLPFAEAELREISRLFAEPRVRYRDEATAAALMAAVPGASYLHFACHGSFDAASPRDSALWLAGQDARERRLRITDQIDGRTFAGIRLVAASACETAITDFTRLPDEAIGLPSAFLQAGSAGVTGTLWQVHDVSACLLMTRFYDYLLAGGDQDPVHPATALRYAQLWLARLSAADLDRYYEQHPALNAARVAAASGFSAALSVESDSLSAHPYSHPVHWAGFVFVGA